MQRGLSRNEIKRILRMGMFSLISIIVVGYTLFAFHDFILGPSIMVYEPANGSTFTSPGIIVRGVVKRIQDITFNDRSITIDEQGNFSEAALLAPGYNIFTLAAKDKFGRSEEYRLEFIYEVN